MNNMSNELKCTSWEEIELKTSWGSIHGKQCGSGGRKILAVHGWLDNANSFNNIVPYLHEDFTLVAIDLPGHGKSDHFQSSFIYDPRSFVMAIKKAITCLGWKNFTYLGHSMGAVVGIIYCSVYPEDIESFISIDIIKPWSTDPSKYPSYLRKYCDSYIKNETISNLTPKVYSKEDLVRMTITGSSNSLDEASAEILLERGAISSDDNSGLILTRDMKAKAYFIGFFVFEAWIAFAKAITSPILMIKAKSGHSYDTEENHQKMLQAFECDSKHYDYHLMDGTHHIHMIHPKEVGEKVQKFLDDTKVYLSDDLNSS